MTNFHNFRQNLNELLGQSPIDCHYDQNPPRPHFCAGCEPGQTFECEQCGRLTSWCNGGDGDALCDSCWSENQPQEDAPIPLPQLKTRKSHD